jgi:selenide,water dikinase
VQAKTVPGGLIANREFAECVVSAQVEVAPELMTLFFDPQTAGGLLISIAQDDADRLEQLTRQAGTPAIRIGKVIQRGEGKPIQLV